MSPAPRDSEAGVTLIEMLVAVAICALIGLAGFSMLDTILRVNARAEGDLDGLAGLDRTFFVLGRDLAAAEAASLRLEEEVLSIRTQGGETLRYDLVEGRLRRHPGTFGPGQLLADGIGAARWRVLDAAGGWADAWQGAGPAMPRAMELRLDLAAPPGGSLRRLFRLTPGLPAEGARP